MVVWQGLARGRAQRQLQEDRRMRRRTPSTGLHSVLSELAQVYFKMPPALMQQKYISRRERIGVGVGVGRSAGQLNLSRRTLTLAAADRISASMLAPSNIGCVQELRL